MRNSCNISVPKKQACESFYDEIFKLIKAVSSETACQKIEMCSAKVLTETGEIYLIFFFLNIITFFFQVEWPNTQLFVQQPTHDGSVCTMCTFLMQLAKEKDRQVKFVLELKNPLNINKKYFFIRK
jgi:hypothetical protein